MDTESIFESVIESKDFADLDSSVKSEYRTWHNTNYDYTILKKIISCLNRTYGKGIGTTSKIEILRVSDILMANL